MDLKLKAIFLLLLRKIEDGKYYKIEVNNISMRS